MTDEQMEYLVERIIQRLRPPVLVMVGPAAGYRQAIRSRLAGCGQRLQLALDEGVPDAAQWQAVGETLPGDTWQEALPSASWRAVVVPFLDYPLAADLVNGTLQNPQARRLHAALPAGTGAALSLRSGQRVKPAARSRQRYALRRTYAVHVDAADGMRCHAVHHE